MSMKNMRNMVKSIKNEQKGKKTFTKQCWFSLEGVVLFTLQGNI